MKKDKIYVESITKFKAPPFLHIRVWRNEPKGPFNYKKGKAEMQAEIDNFQPREKDITKVAKALLKIPRVNAVEVTILDGDGIVLYKNWP